MPVPARSVPLSDGQREILAAVIRTVVPHISSDAAREGRLIARVGADLARIPRHKQRRLVAGLQLLGSPLGSAVAFCLPKAFGGQPEQVRERVFDRWLNHFVPQFRSVAHALRRLILFAEYTTPEGQREVAYRGPYHLRGPAFPWEGALDGIPRGDEPVARALLPTAAHLPPALESSVEAIELPPVVKPVAAPAADGDSRARVPTPDRIRAGVIVIGSGAGGAVAAARLAEAGHDVLILERGELITGEELDEREHEMLSRLYAEGGQRTTDDASLAMIQGSCVGGGTTVNWMIMLRTPDWVLDEWTAYHGAEGMKPGDLAPVFDRIEEEVHARLVPDDAHSPNNRIILDGARALGWSAYAGRINAKGCVRSGFCGSGCRYGAKQGGLQTYLPRALQAGARLIASARATKIELVERSGSFPLKRVTFEYAPPDGEARIVEAEAPVVIVASGAIETPALLERSYLGGEGTGRYMRVHPTVPIFGRYEKEVYGAGGIPLTAVCDQFLRIDGGYGVWIECPPLHSGLAGAAFPGIGAPHRALMDRFPNMGSLVVLCRDGAQRGHSDGEVRARADGGVSIRYRLNPRDALHLEHGLVAAARLHFAAGAREVVSSHNRPVTLRSPNDLDRLRAQSMSPNRLALFTAHVNGTCRLGASRLTAGTDPHGEVFGAPGVFVADGSLVPTALGVNPQETIMALASIVSERIAARRRPS